MEPLPLEAECLAFGPDGCFQTEYTGRGADRSPEIRLRHLSPEAKTLAVTLEDLDHLLPCFTHWVIWNLPAEERIAGAIPHGRRTPQGAVQGIGYGVHRYAGPKPPRGRIHRYRFTVYALDTALALGACAGKRGFLRAARGHVLQTAAMTGAFGADKPCSIEKSGDCDDN